MRNQPKENDNGRHRPAHKNEKQNVKTVNEKDRKDRKDRKTET